MTLPIPTRIHLGHRVTFRLTGHDGTRYQRRITWQQLAGMVAKLRTEQRAQIPGVDGIDFGLTLIDTCDGGLGVVLTGGEAQRVGRAHMSDLDRALSVMDRSAA